MLTYCFALLKDTTSNWVIIYAINVLQNLLLITARNDLGLSATVHMASTVRRITGSFHSALRAHSCVVAFQPAQPFSYNNTWHHPQHIHHLYYMLKSDGKDSIIPAYF